MPSCFKLLMFFSAPFPFLPSAAIRFARHSRHPLPALSASAAAHGRLLSSAPNLKLGFSIRLSEQFHAQAIVKEGHGETVNTFPGFKDSQSWPEWSKLTDHLLNRGYSPQSAAPSDSDDSLLSKEELPEEFLKAAEACLGFARERPDILRLLSKRNVEAVVKNGYPFLFKNSEKSARRMRLFIADDESNVPEPEMAQTIDVMRYLLSIVQKTLSTSNGDKFIVSGSVETSARKLLLELFNLSGTVRRSKSPEPTATESPIKHEPLSRPPGQSFEMKRGDWICSKCTFMNFARNMNCLECGEGRPKRQLTGAEWECPQCDFFNYGRNTSCLRCDCKRPGEVQPTPAPSAAGSGLGRSSNIEQIFSVHGQDSNGGSSVKLSSDTISDSISRSLDRILGPSSAPSGNQSTVGDSNPSTLGSFSSSEYGQTMEKQRRKTDSVSFVPLPPDMFRKTQESNNVVEQSSEKGVASSSNASELIDSLLKSSEKFIKNNNSKESSAASLRWSKTAAELDNAKDMENAVSDKDFPDIMPIRKGENRFVVSKKKDRSLTSPAYKRRLAMEQANNYNSIPFVPFPPDYFAKKDNQPLTDSTESTAPLDENETMPEGQGEHKGISDQVLEGSSSPQSGRSYEDDYKPDYSGVKLNQSTTNSWDYNRETSNKTPKSSAFDEQSLGQNMANASYGSAYSTQPDSSSGKYGGCSTNNTNELSRSSWNNNTSYGDTVKSSQQSNASWANSNSSSGAANSTQPSNRSTSGGFTANTSQPPTNTLDNNTFDESTVNSTQPSRSLWNNNWDNCSRPPQTNNVSSGSYQQAQNHQSASKNVSGGYSGKSLEGSCVKELDPLDMSEEAKAERWFRRAAQIKDISELSQIPDEDFPEIMPMRKGVNRFVVSKRKTPQERRLTSPQYRRNLPIVSSEPEKDANN